MTAKPKLDKKILEAAKKGDLAAFEQILFLFEKPIFNYIYRLTGRREDAEDLTQETFIKLYKSISSIDPENNVKSWLYKIATNTAYDWLRQKRGKKELYAIDADSDKRFETTDPDPTYYNIENAFDMEKALVKIKPAYKTILHLFYYDDLDYKKIANILNIPINTVKTYLRRAKLALKKELIEEDQLKN